MQTGNQLGSTWKIVCLLLAAVSLDCHAGPELITRPVPEGGGPTIIRVALGLLDIDEIDSANQNFTANLFLAARWHDPRLAHAGPGIQMKPVSEVWNPVLLFVNQQKIWPSMPEVVRIDPSGEVEYDQRVWGPFSQPLDVHDFPADTQDFEIRIASVASRTDALAFEVDPENASGLAPQFSLPDWEIVEWKLDFSPYAPVGSRQGVSSFALVLTARRHISHYVFKIILPLVLIVAMSWIVFWIDPRESGTQIAVATTSMLTLIAYRFMVGGQIPAVPYLTRMDTFILASTLLVFAALMQAVITSIMANREHVRGARWIDRCCRIIFPATFAAVFAFSLVL